MRKLAKKVKIQQSLQSNRSEPVIKRSIILPAPIDLVAPALAADAGGEAHAAVQILVRGRDVNHVGAVNRYVTGFVIRHEPVHDEAFGLV